MNHLICIRHGKQRIQKVAPLQTADWMYHKKSIVLVVEFFQDALNRRSVLLHQCVKAPLVTSY